MLRLLPFDGLKVDRGLVSFLTAKRENRKIVSAVASLGRDLGPISSAEGIEMQEQAETPLSQDDLTLYHAKHAVENVRVLYEARNVA